MPYEKHLIVGSILASAFAYLGIVSFAIYLLFAHAGKRLAKHSHRRQRVHVVPPMHDLENLPVGVYIMFSAIAAPTWLMPRCASGYQPDLA